VTALIFRFAICRLVPRGCSESGVVLCLVYHSCYVSLALVVGSEALFVVFAILFLSLSVC